MRQNRGKERRLSQLNIVKREGQQNTKYLLPKLKSYSQNDCSRNSQLPLKRSIGSKLLVNEDNSSHKRSLSNSKQEFNKLGLVKYQYVNKSPNYFKKKFKSIEAIRKYQYSDQLVNLNRQHSQINVSNKLKLLDLINQIINQTISKHKSIPISKNQNYQTLQKNQKKKSSILQESLKSYQQTNYSKNKLTKSKVKFDKIKAFISSQKYSKTIDSSLKQTQKYSFQDQTNNMSNHKKTQDTNIQLFDTKYSNFKPNSILNLKSQFKVLNKNSYPRLDFYRFG